MEREVEELLGVLARVGCEGLRNWGAIHKFAFTEVGPGGGGGGEMRLRGERNRSLFYSEFRARGRGTRAL